MKKQKQQATTKIDEARATTDRYLFAVLARLAMKESA